MEVKIETTTENKLLDRKEIDATVHFSGPTPPRKEIKDAICGKIGANPDLVVLRSVQNEFGVKRVKVSAHVYENAEKMKSTEPEYIVKREGMGEEAKPETGKQAEEKKEEKPAEKKEEKPKEETAKETETPKKEEAKPETGSGKPETPKEG